MDTGSDVLITYTYRTGQRGITEELSVVEVSLNHPHHMSVCLLLSSIPVQSGSA